MGLHKMDGGLYRQNTIASHYRLALPIELAASVEIYKN